MWGDVPRRRAPIDVEEAKGKETGRKEERVQVGFCTGDDVVGRAVSSAGQDKKDEETAERGRPEPCERTARSARMRLRQGICSEMETGVAGFLAKAPLLAPLRPGGKADNRGARE